MKYSKIRSVCFCLLWCWPLGACSLDADEGKGKPIEIFISGKQYDSFEGYRRQKSKESLEAQEDNEEIQTMFDEALHASKSPVDLKFDPKKVKTIHIKKRASEASSKIPVTPELITKKDPFTHSYLLLNQMGFDAGIHKVVSDFTDTEAKASQKVVSAGDLQEVFKDSLGETGQPLLLISDQKKVRVMMLDVQKKDAEASAPVPVDP